MRLLNTVLKQQNLLLFAFIFFFTSNVSAQEHLPKDEQTGKYFYSKVIFVDSTGKDELFRRAHKWFNNHFETEDTALKVVDGLAGQISGNGTTKLLIKNKGFESEVPMYFTLNVFVKGNRCKFEFTDIVYKPKGTSFTAEKKFNSGKLNATEMQYLNKTKKAFITFEKTLVSAMTDNSEAPVVKKFQLKKM